MAIIDTDRFLVQRANKSYRVDASEVASLAGDTLQTATDRGAHTTHNVGIGGTPGNAAITLSNTGRGTFNDSVFVQEPGGDPAVKINLTASTGEILTTTSRTDGTSMIRIQDGNGADAVALAANGNAAFQGNVAIGKASATVALDIDGKAQTLATASNDPDTTLTTKKYVDDQVTAGTTILAITGGNGITATAPDANKSITISSDHNTNKGLDIDTGKLVTKLGAGLEFDSNGKIAVSSTAINYKGTVDLTQSTIPANPVQGDSHANTGSGAMHADWLAAFSLGATTVAEGDLVVYNGTAWTYIPTGGVIPPTDLDIINRGEQTLDIESSTGDDATIPAATTLLCGLMTKTDKTRLDSLYSDQSTLGDGKMWIGNAAGAQTAQTLSGDLTVTNAGVTTIKTSVALAGSPTTTTQAANTNDTTIATTQFVNNAVTAAEYVEKAGDNMTGNLTFGPESGTKVITLNQTTGGASFAAAVGIGPDAASPKISLNADGSARFDSNVGIGVTTASNRLHVKATTEPVARFESAGSNAKIYFASAGSTSNGNYLQQTGDKTEFFTASTRALTMLGNGNTGIGEAAPVKKLHVAGGAAITEDTVIGPDPALPRITLGATGNGIFKGSLSTDGTLTVGGAGSVGTDLTVGLVTTSREFVANIPAITADNDVAYMPVLFGNRPPKLGTTSPAPEFDFSFGRYAEGTENNSSLRLIVAESGPDSPEWYWNDTGESIVPGDIIPDTDGGASLGSTTKRFSNVYTQDMHFSNEGTDGNSIDGTTGDWTLQEGDENLYFINNKTGMKFRVVMEAV